MYAYVVTLLRDRAAAEDVTAQAFERAFRKARTLRPAQGRRRARWLFGIARNAALDELRRRKRTAAAGRRAASTPPAAPRRRRRARARPRRRARRARRAARRATARSIALKFHAGLDNAEIAAVLGVSVSNAGTQLHRAMTKLREAVDDRA